VTHHGHSSGQGVFEALYRDWYDYAWTVARRALKSDEDASDAVQQVFSRLWGLPAAAYPRVPRAYFRTACTREAISLIRKRRVEDVLKRAVRAAITEPHDASTAFEDGFSVLAQLGIRLPPRCRIVVALVIEGYTHPEIAVHLGVHTKAVEKQVARARRLIRRQGPQATFRRDVTDIISKTLPSEVSSIGV
jgi:RNA polymerase sigma factor (sigma-70 family)